MQSKSEDVKVRRDLPEDLATGSDEAASNHVDVDLEFLASNVGILEARFFYLQTYVSV